MGFEMDIARLERFVLEKMAETRIPGLSIAIIVDRDIVYQRGFGYRDLEESLPATPRTVYGIGSITKTFTAIAVMQLVEEGKLSLDDPVEKYLDLKLEVGGEPVRIEHLLTHTSGYPALGYAEALIQSLLEPRGPAWLPIAGVDDVIAFVRGAGGWAVAKPGERFFYLNEGYVLLGKIIEKVSGLRYEDYVRKYILEPLGMDRTYPSREEAENDTDLASPYIVLRDGSVKRARAPHGITADGGMYSNVLDLLKLIVVLISGGTYGSTQVLSRSAVREITKPRVRLPYIVFGEESYGYGVTIYPRFLGRYKLVGHSGSVLVYTGFYGYVESEKIGVAVLANSSGYPPSHIGMYALALLLGHNPEEEIPFIKAERVLKKLEGRYENYMATVTVTVSRLGDFLLLEYNAGIYEVKLPLVPDKVEEDYALFWTIEAGRRIPIEFFVRNDRVEMIFERYRLVKKSGL